MENERIVDAYVKSAAKKGWQITNQSEFGAQFTKPKQVSLFWLVTGLLLLPFWGIGLIFWGIALLDYIYLKSDKISFVTYSRMRKQLRGRS